ncbi:MAG: hypothetical protein QXL14_02190 [Candidatus Aenigmatarchaeota archaeon]
MSVVIGGLPYEEYVRKFGEEEAKKTLQRLYGTTDIKVAEEISKQRQKKVVEEAHGTLVGIEKEGKSFVARIRGTSVEPIGVDNKISTEEKQSILQLKENIGEKGELTSVSFSQEQTQQGIILHARASYMPKIPEGKVVFVHSDSGIRAFVVGEDYKVKDLPKEIEQEVIKFSMEKGAENIRIEGGRIIGAIRKQETIPNEQKKVIDVRPGDIVSVGKETLTGYDIVKAGGIKTKEDVKNVLEEINKEKRLRELHELVYVKGKYEYFEEYMKLWKEFTSKPAVITRVEAFGRVFEVTAPDVAFFGLQFVPGLNLVSSTYFVVRSGSHSIQTTQEILKEGLTVERAVDLALSTTATALGVKGMVSGFKSGVYPGMQKEIVNTKALVDTKVISQGEKGYYETVIKTKVDKNVITSKEFGHYTVTEKLDDMFLGETKGLRITKIQRPARFGFTRETTIIETTTSEFAGRGQEIYYPSRAFYRSLKVETPEGKGFATKTTIELDKGYIGVGVSKSGEDVSISMLKARVFEGENTKMLSGLVKGFSRSENVNVLYVGKYTQISSTTQTTSLSGLVQKQASQFFSTTVKPFIQTAKSTLLPVVKAEEIKPAEEIKQQSITLSTQDIQTSSETPSTKIETVVKTELPTEVVKKEETETVAANIPNINVEETSLNIYTNTNISTSADTSIKTDINTNIDTTVDTSMDTSISTNITTSTETSTQLETTTAISTFIYQPLPKFTPFPQKFMKFVRIPPVHGSFKGSFRMEPRITFKRMFSDIRDFYKPSVYSYNFKVKFADMNNFTKTFFRPLIGRKRR